MGANDRRRHPSVASARKPSHAGIAGMMEAIPSYPLKLSICSFIRKLCPSINTVSA